MAPHEQNGRHFADEYTFIYFLIKISLKFVPNDPTDNKPVLVQVMAWRRTGDKPLSEPMLTPFTDSLGGWSVNWSVQKAPHSHLYVTPYSSACFTKTRNFCPNWAYSYYEFIYKNDVNSYFHTQIGYCRTTRKVCWQLLTDHWNYHMRKHVYSWSSGWIMFSWNESETVTTPFTWYV